MKMLIRELQNNVIELLVLLEQEQKFDWREFRQIKEQQSRLNYAATRLKLLGEPGSSRAAFQYGKHALKIALNQAGIGQNKSEESVNSKFPQITAKVVYSSPDGGWILSELVKQFKTAQEFEHATGVPADVFSNILDLVAQGKDWKKPYNLFATNKFINTIIKFSLTAHVGASDLGYFDHYGYSSDGRIVILDYGLTHHVAKTHYRVKEVPQQSTRKDKPQTVPQTTPQLPQSGPTAANDISTRKAGKRASAAA